MVDRPDRFDDPDAPPTDEERAAAERLRAALDDPRRPGEQAELARALTSAWSPRDLPRHAHEALVEQALSRHDRRRRRPLSRASLAAGAVLALAAAVLLSLRSERQTDRRPVAVTAVAFSRSTQALFPEGFPATGGETSRIDRIAMARAGDLRDNEFARWGVR